MSHVLLNREILDSLVTVQVVQVYKATIREVFINSRYFKMDPSFNSLSLSRNLVHFYP